MNTKNRIVVVFFAAALALLPGAAMAQQYPPAGPADCIQTKKVDGTPSTVFAAGEPILVESQATGGRRCFDPGTQVTISFIQSEVVIATTTADATGNYSATGRIPRDARPGTASIQATGQLERQPISYSQPITILAPAEARPAAPGVGPRLPVTGSDIAILSLWGLGLVAVGTVLVRTTRRRIRSGRNES